MAIEGTVVVSYYDVVITSLAAAAPRDGFIDHKEPQHYSTFPTTLILSTAKERANMRWKAILRNLSIVVNPIHVINMVATGATQDAAATQFSFTVSYDKETYLMTKDELNPGAVLSDVAAIKRFIARALIETMAENREIYNPTLVDGVVQGPMYFDVTAGPAALSIAAAEAAITVTKVVL